MEATVINVWAENMKEQLDILSMYLREHNFVAIDAEFPKFIRNAPRNSSEEELYKIVKFNVDQQNLIQLGFTLLSNTGSMPVSDVNAESCLSWQFNFREYNPADDGVPSIRKSGINLEKNMRDGIDACSFSSLFRDIVLIPFFGHLKWITFHGIYDIAYIIKLITQQPLPETLFDFLLLCKCILGKFFDVKYLARFCQDLLDGETSLKRLSYDLFDIRVSGGNLHQAGYDSILTAGVFWGMKAFHNMREEQGACILYGLEENCKQFLQLQHQRQLWKRRRFVSIHPRFCVFPNPMRPRPPFPIPIMRAAPPPSYYLVPSRPFVFQSTSYG